MGFFSVSFASAQSCGTLFQRSVDTVHLLVNGDRRELQIFTPQKPRKKNPVVIYFHGTNVPVKAERPNPAPFGLDHESRWIHQLTQAGFVVIAPTANQVVPYLVFPSVTAWEANLAPYSHNFERSRDFALSQRLFKNLQEITNLPIDTDNVFLAGFSSGGYMASRLAVMEAFQNKIRGLIVHSASYGTCIGSQCAVPRELPPWHPPTLLISNQDDSIVPHHTVELYLSRLERNQIPADTLFSQEGDHAWMMDHPPQILQWIRRQLSR